MITFPTEVKDFLSQNSLATLATISKDSDYPHLVSIFYTIDENFSLFFATRKDGQKLRNIQYHPKVSLCITNLDHLTSLELCGTAVISEPAEPFIIEHLLKVANADSEGSLPPLMQLQGDKIILVSFTAEHYNLSNYSGKKPTKISS